jgi:uncharacterized protein YjbJ (UPF0337 family)
MARFTIKALAVAALVCLVFDLSSALPAEEQQQQHTAAGHETTADEKDTATTPAAGTLKDKFKGFVSSVKDGAADAFDSVSDSVSGAAHKLDEKRKEAVAGTKKLVNGAIDKIKSTFNKHGDSSEEVPRDPTPAEEKAKEAYDQAISAMKN